jgi:hypothetical protein
MQLGRDHDDGARFACLYAEDQMTRPDHAAEANQLPPTTESADTGAAASRPTEYRGITPQDPITMPRAEDDRATFDNSPEFHDRPDPGPNVGRENT